MTVVYVYGLLGFCILPSNDLLGVFVNVMKLHADLVFCFVYFAPPIQHQ